MSIGPKQEHSPLSPDEQWSLDTIGAQFATQDPDFVRFMRGEPLRPSAREVRGILGGWLLRLSVPVAVIAGVGSAITVFSGMTEAAEQRRQEGVERVLDDPAKLRQLGLCSFELDAQAKLYDARAAVYKNDAANRGQAARFRHAATVAPDGITDCSPPRDIEARGHLTVMLSSDDAVQVTATDVTLYDLSSWCAGRSDQDNPGRAATPYFRIGDEMLAEATDALGGNDPCTR